MPQKVLYIVTKATWGGAQRYVFDLATNLPRDGYEALVAAGGSGTLFELCTEQGIRCAQIPGLTRDVGLFSDIYALISLVTILRKEQPTVVHLNSSKAGGLGALVARIMRVPRIVFTIHGLPQDEPRSGFSKALITVSTWLTCALSHEIICISKNNYERVCSWYGLAYKTHLIYNGVPAFVTFSRSEAREKLSIPETQFVIGTVAELHPNKGLDSLLRAVARLPHAHLISIGDGEKKEALKRLSQELQIENRVRFLGFVPHAREYLSAFDVLCLPSLKEGLPYVLLEAQVAGVPIVASELPGIRELVGTEALLVPPQSVSGLVSALTHPQNPKPLLAQFSFTQMLESTYALYQPRLDR